MATNPLYNAGLTSFAADPYQIKSERDALIQAGLWNPAWDAWAQFQGGGDDTLAQAPAMPDFSSLNGYQVGAADFGGGNRLSDLIAPDGSVAVSTPYVYDEPSMGEQLAQGAAIVGGAALGMNAAFGGLGGAAGGLSGMDIAADAGMGAFGGGGGAAGGGIGTLSGTLPALPAGVGSISTLPTIGAGASVGALGGAIPSVAGGGGIMGTLGSLGSALTSGNGLANLGSAAIGLIGQGQALGAMNDATNSANEFNRYAFDTIRADNKPLVDLRNSVLPQIQGLLSNPGSVMNDPGNQFQFAQGQKALANGAAGSGMTYSGAQGKALQRYGQDFASTKLDDSLRRLQSVAGLGQVGSNSNNQATQNYANNGSNNALNMGQGRSSVYGNMANIAGNALSGIFNPWQYGQINGGG